MLGEVSECGQKTERTLRKHRKVSNAGRRCLIVGRSVLILGSVPECWTGKRCLKVGRSAWVSGECYEKCLNAGRSVCMLGERSECWGMVWMPAECWDCWEKSLNVSECWESVWMLREGSECWEKCHNAERSVWSQRRRRGYAKFTNIFAKSWLLVHKGPR